MSLWRRTRAEMSGAWRSMRYDLGRRPSEPPAEGPDVTSTGMTTFGGQSMEFPGGYETEQRTYATKAAKPPRRALAVSAFGLLTVAGATGAYLVVANGLVPLLGEHTAAAEMLPAPPAITAESGIGAGPVTPAGHRPHLKANPSPGTPKPPTNAADVATAGLPPSPAPLNSGKKVSPIRSKKSANTKSAGSPPVPTPTAPDSPSSTPAPALTQTSDDTIDDLGDDGPTGLDGLGGSSADWDDPGIPPGPHHHQDWRRHRRHH